jgi:starch-binding outer membrane protein, SusD/RagB family
MKKICSIIFLTIVCSACENFLEQVPESARSEVNFFKTSADFLNANVGMYSSLKLNGIYGSGTGSLFYLQETVSDNTNIGTTRQIVNVPEFEIDDFNISIANNVIQRAWESHYITIGRANVILGRLPTATFDQALKDRLEGEALFMRAMMYFNLVRLFGDVQLVTTEITDFAALNNTPRTPQAEIYNQIISDLKVAETKLPAVIPANEAGRASRWAAKSLLGKVYLTNKNYTDAAAKLLEVITSSGRSLMTNYAQVFSFQTTFAANTEVIFAVQYKSGQIGQGGNLWSAWAPFNAGAVLLGPIGGAGGGFNRPTADMAAAYEPNDVRRNASLATSYQNGAIPVNESFVVKFRQQGALGGDEDTDFPILRYADVLLMYAEALNELNQTAQALPFLNQVRTRAGLPAKNSLTQAEFRLDMEQERRVELAFENHRWPDLVRTDRYLTVMTGKGLPTKDFHKLYPVPQRETDLNKGLGQNPGY